MFRLWVDKMLLSIVRAFSFFPQLRHSVPQAALMAVLRNTVSQLLQSDSHVFGAYLLEHMIHKHDNALSLQVKTLIVPTFNNLFLCISDAWNQQYCKMIY